MSSSYGELFERCVQDPQWESENVSLRPLRGLQSEIIKKIEKFLYEFSGGVMPIMICRQIGKNEMAAVLQRRHLWRNQFAVHKRSWIRTAPTHEPQIVNSKKRLDEILKLDKKNVSHHPLFLQKKIQKSEGYIYKLGNSTVEFMSSGPHSNVVGATASMCLDMDEAHTIDLSKMDEDFLPMTASTNAGTLMWGVAADGKDPIETYRQINIENGEAHLNLYYPCEVWMEILPSYRGHVERRVKALGWDHPIIKTQYRLIPVAHEGTFINAVQARHLLAGGHERQLAPRPGQQYEMVIDIAAGNEEFNPDQAMKSLDTDSDEATTTDSTVIWIYEVTDQIAQNNIFPVLNLVNVYKWTGLSLPKQEEEIIDLIEHWHVSKITIDGVGVGRQMAESLEQRFGVYIVNKYIANSTSVSEDCFDLLARLNYSSVKMFQDDGSSEYQEFVRQIGWTKYAASKGKMNLAKPQADKHIDMVKALTYIGRNKPDATMHQILSVESEY